MKPNELPLSSPKTQLKKGDFPDENGAVLVRYSISRPEIEGNAAFNRFYEQASDGFFAFACGELADVSRKNPPQTPPCGAVLLWKEEPSDPAHLAIRLEGSVFDGTTTRSIPPEVHLWDRKTGRLQK